MLIHRGSTDGSDSGRAGGGDGDEGEEGEMKHLIDNGEWNEGVKEKRVSALAAQLGLRAIERRERGKEPEQERGRNTSQAFDVDHCRPNI